VKTLYISDYGDMTAPLVLSVAYLIVVVAYLVVFVLWPPIATAMNFLFNHGRVVKKERICGDCGCSQDLPCDLQVCPCRCHLRIGESLL
jgi:hypothetical protein